MEAVKQSLDSLIITTLLVVAIGVAAVGAIGAFFIDNSIITDEAFKVTSDTSKYSCIVSEIDNDLSLDCLKIK